MASTTTTTKTQTETARPPAAKGTLSVYSLPPFPDNLVTAPLLTLNLAKLLASDPAECDNFFKASKELGFAYLDLRGSAEGEQLFNDAQKLLQVGKELFELPTEEKEKYGRPTHGFFGHRAPDNWTMNKFGKLDRNENFNVRKDDLVGNTEPLPAPDVLKTNWALMQSYARTSRLVIDHLLELLNTHLGLAPGTLASLHRIDHRSGDHVRFTRGAPLPDDEDRYKLGEHTDFGSLTILFNWLGGLQVRLPGTMDWVYVKPVPGCCVLNLGDALVKFTAGILRSNIHRVARPPGLQADETRHSLVYFSRPEDDVVLRRLKGGLVDLQPPTELGEEMTANEWIMRRSLGDLKGVYTVKGLEKRGYE